MTPVVEVPHDRPLANLMGIARSALSQGSLLVRPASELRVPVSSEDSGSYRLTAVRLDLS